MLPAELLNLLPYHEQSDFAGGGESAGDVGQGFFGSTFFDILAPLQNFLVVIKIFQRITIMEFDVFSFLLRILFGIPDDILSFNRGRFFLFRVDDFF